MINDCVYYKLMIIARILIATNKWDYSFLLLENTYKYRDIYGHLPSRYT